MSEEFLILSLVIVAILIRLQPVDLVFRTFNTLTHELSHAIVAKLFRQKVEKIVINRDFSGSCTTKITDKRTMFFISLVGYIFPSVIGYLLVHLSLSNITSTTFYVFVVVSALALIFFIGNSFGRVWTICFCALNLVFALVPIFSLIYNNIIYIYAIILLIENLLSIITLIYITLSSPKTKTDARSLKQITKIPSFLWSLLFFAVAFWFIVLSIRLLVK